MIQSGSGLFEYSFGNEVILSGQIAFLKDINLGTKLKISKSLDKTSEDFLGQVSKDEIYDILNNNGFNLGDNFKNIINFEMYKRDIQGYVKWENDWIYFLDGLLKFPLLQNLSIYQTKTPIFIRQISIDPSMLAKNNEEGKYIKCILVCIYYFLM